MYPTSQMVMSYLEKMGKRGELVISTLGKKQGFIDAVNSKLGKEIMEDLISMYEDGLAKIIQFDANEEDKAEFKAVSKLIDIWVSKITDYERKNKEIIYVATAERK
jgi:hypothetical protein